MGFRKKGKTPDLHWDPKDERAASDLSRRKPD
jgi:hypothetical protein